MKLSRHSKVLVIQDAELPGRRKEGYGGKLKMSITSPCGAVGTNDDFQLDVNYGKIRRVRQGSVGGPDDGQVRPRGAKHGCSWALRPWLWLSDQLGTSLDEAGGEIGSHAWR